MTRILLAIAVLLSTLGQPAWGQLENSNWYFGNNAAIRFPAGGSPVPLAGSAMTTYEACVSVSDAAGQLQFYSNSETVWNRNNQVMTNGTSLGGWLSAAQGAVIVQNPGNAQQYYLFVTDGAANQGILKYNLLDMAKQGGLGEVTTKAVPVAAAGPLTEKLTSVPHANGRDTWVLVHGWQSNVFYAYLVTPSGVQTVPVATAIGSAHSGGGATYGNSVGYMRASPDGTRLAVAIRDSRFEVFDFDPATGQLSNYIPLYGAQRCYGVAFSPNGRLLYGTSLNYDEIYQFDLQAGSATAVSNSLQTIGFTSADVGSIQPSPDGQQLYVALLNSPYLGVVQNPNVRGSGCAFRTNGVYLGGATSQLGLPNYTNTTRTAPVVTADFTAATACAGQATSFTATVAPALTGTTATWNFGDPATATNTATGLTATHAFSQAGSYQVTLVVTAPGLATPVTVAHTLTALPTPAPRLADTTACGSSALLRVRGSLPVGSTYRWQDNSTGTTYLARQSGTYSVVVTTPQGCQATATSRVVLGPVLTVTLGTDTLVCPQATFVLRPSPQPAGTTYRWQDGSTASTYVAHGPGTYSVQVQSASAGCTATATRVANPLSCPIIIPNIITPNGDVANDYFELKGLTAADWSIRIFDRWGRQVYSQARYDNRWGAADQSAGIYYYLLTNAAGQQYKGWVELVRAN